MTRAHPLENRIPPPVVAMLVGAAMAGASLVTSTLGVSLALRLSLGAAFALVGLSVLALGAMTFRRAKTTIDPVRVDRASTLVTGGIFRLTRNPMYVGFTLVLVSISAFLAAPWTLLGPLLFVAFTTRFQILPEERALRAKFGSAYVDYQSNSRRWL